MATLLSSSRVRPSDMASRTGAWEGRWNVAQEHQQTTRNGKGAPASLSLCFERVPSWHPSSAQPRQNLQFRQPNCSAAGPAQKFESQRKKKIRLKCPARNQKRFPQILPDTKADAKRSIASSVRAVMWPCPGSCKGQEQKHRVLSPRNFTEQPMFERRMLPEPLI